ncbi:MAG TPA: glycosyltransferase [Terracidiphilus sp.]|jgi:glycosyltransferase involved in cell wall biosynthesis|nr:glycosyltransferase [Terracidiphilus sp.]
MICRPVVLLLIPHLGGGGAERVLELLAQHISPEKYDLHLGLVTQSGAVAQLIPPTVKVHCIGAKRVRSGVWKVVRLVHHVRPNLILSTMAHLNFLILALRPLFPLGTRVVVRQNGTVSSMLRESDAGHLTPFLYATLYPRADKVICQSRSMADDLCSTIPVLPDRIAILPNPVDTTHCPAQHSHPEHQARTTACRLVSAGRLSHEKGYDLLLDALRLVKAQVPEATLALAGAGPEETVLRAQCKMLGLENAVRFLGYQNSLARAFEDADLFVLPSRHEGMPNALLEAAAFGLPIVSTPACGGIVDLLRNSPGSWTAREITAGALADQILLALRSIKPAARCDHSWVQAFRLANAIPQYEALFDRMIGRGHD